MAKPRYEEDYTWAALIRAKQILVAVRQMRKEVNEMEYELRQQGLSQQDAMTFTKKKRNTIYELMTYLQNDNLWTKGWSWDHMEAKVDRHIRLWEEKEDGDFL